MLGIYALFDPSETWWMPKCPVYFITGIECPGCGSQRAVYALLHGDIEKAFEENALLLVMIPFLLVMTYSELTREKNPGLYRRMSHPWIIIGIIILVFGWTLFRNL